MLIGGEHVRRYRQTGGQEGYRWNGVKTLILTTTGRRSSAACQPELPRRFPPSPGRRR